MFDRLRQLAAPLASRLRSRWRIGAGVQLWYHPQYAIPSLTQTSRALSIVPMRGEFVLGELASEGLLRPGDVCRPVPASFKDLALVHGMPFLESTNDAQSLAHVFGMEPALIDVDEFVTSQRYAVGGTVSAAQSAVRGDTRVAVNLGGGFHHANPDRGAGFCIFNDIAVAIAVLRKGGFNAPIAIVDLDFHQGDGNLVIFAEDPTVLTYSIHGSAWATVDAVADLGILLEGADDRRYLRALRTTLHDALLRHRPKLIFYIAGNDVLSGDQLGGFDLSVDGVFARDQYVIHCAREIGAPLVVTLGGGYHEDAWHCTSNLLSWVLGSPRLAHRRDDGEIRRNFTHIAQSLDPTDLRYAGDLNLQIEMADIMGELLSQPANPRFLGFYSRNGVELALERYGLLQKIRRQGIHSLTVTIDPSNPDQQILRVTGRSGDFIKTAPFLVLEIVVSRKRHRLPLTEGADGLDCITVEWLLMQDPSREFSDERPQLPGQDHPGLGLAMEVKELLYQACTRVDCGGIATRPAHFHNAWLQHQTGFRFLDPELEGELEALAEKLADTSLHELTWAIADGTLRFADDSTYRWRAGEQLLPVAAKLHDYFNGADYDRAQRRAKKAFRKRQPQLPLLDLLGF